MCRYLKLGVIHLCLLLSTSLLAWDSNNKIEILDDGIKLHQKRLDLLNEAKVSIYISAFSMHAGKVMDRFSKLLCQKVDEGVDVRIIYDHRNNKDFYDLSETLKKCGVSLIRYRPKSRLFALHEKLFIIDGIKVITGGSGYANSYVRASAKSWQETELLKHNVKRGWYDSDFLITGNAACTFHLKFINHFILLSKSLYDYNPDYSWYGHDNFVQLIPKLYRFGYFKACQKTSIKHGDANVLAVLGTPNFTKERPIRDAYTNSIERAIKENAKSIKIYSPYHVPTKRMVKDLIKARKHNIDVTIITNSPETDDNAGKSKHALFAAVIAATKPLLKNGVKIRLWNRLSTMHRKGGVFGHSIAFFGSDNLDYRGQNYQSESVAFTDDKLVIKTMHENFKRDLKNTIPFDQDYIKKLEEKTPGLYQWVGKKFKHYF